MRTFDVLICSSRTSAAGLNLQADYADVIIMDMIPMNAINQVFGRVHCFGQEHEQHGVVLVTDRTYDQVLMSKFIERTITQLTTTSVKKLLEPELRNDIETRIRRQVTDVQETTGLSHEESVQAIGHHLNVEAAFNMAYGIRGPHANPFYSDETDLDKKLGLQYEFEYMQTVPGYADILKEYLARPYEGTNAPSTPKKKTFKKKSGTSTLGQLMRNYNKKYPDVMALENSPRKGMFLQLIKICQNNANFVIDPIKRPLNAQEFALFRKEIKEMVSSVP
jgi:hypothetical protein